MRLFLLAETRMTFDRLLYIGRLKDAGVDEGVARAHAEALRDALFETVATKSDLTEAVASLRSDLHDAVAMLDRKIEVTARDLDRKIEITARDLIIKGTGGLIIIASLIIGFKLFG
jgi:hypothetical protein